MAIQCIFAEVCVTDMARSVDWYRKFFGREPDDRPMDGLVQWRLGPAGLQVWRDAGRAGSSVSTIVVTNMDEERLRLAAAGIQLPPDQQGGGVVIAQIEDPDGNVLTLAEPPKAN